MTKAQLTPEQIKNGMTAIRAWYNDHPDRESPVIVSGSLDDCWSPERIMQELEKREKAEDWDWDKGDIPEMILESISKSKKYTQSA